ncbi:hypothetical protein LR948_01825 [Roseivivax sp. GX 12232]|uniref:hypothetical protein n=1 Tax=Roseivivax sp. GX 12232 TaxID=2900547 RepID=UPI001E421E89|nr:hypothetical protein [Roseivivax sp. GX 12232]MCE0504085.1 hypothetical protein [Roseivivax sp. GX 12232]
MAAPAQVTWAKTDKTGAEIVAIGGVRKSLFGKAEWRLSVEEAVTLIEQDEWRFFVEDRGDRLWLDLCEDEEGAKTISADGPVKLLL